MTKNAEGVTPQPAPEEPLSPANGLSAAAPSPEMPAVCPIWKEACRPVIDPATGQIIGRICLLAETVRNQPPEHGEVRPESIHRMVSRAEELGEGDGYDGPCPELVAVKRIAEEKRAKYPLKSKGGQS